MKTMKALLNPYFWGGYVTGVGWPAMIKTPTKEWSNSSLPTSSPRTDSQCFISWIDVSQLCSIPGAALWNSTSSITYLKRTCWRATHPLQNHFLTAPKHKSLDPTPLKFHHHPFPVFSISPSGLGKKRWLKENQNSRKKTAPQAFFRAKAAYRFLLLAHRVEDGLTQFL